DLGTGLSATPHGQDGHAERAGLHVCRPFPVGFFKDADSHVAHRPISGPQSVQVTMLSFVEWAGTTNLLLPHLRHLRGQVCVSALIGSGMTLRPFWSVELPQERSG